MQQTINKIEDALSHNKLDEALALTKVLPNVVLNDDISFNDVPKSNTIWIYKTTKPRSNIE